MTTPTLHRWALTDRSGKTRMTCTAPEGQGSIFGPARDAFIALRGGRPIPDGWVVVGRGPEPRPFRPGDRVTAKGFDGVGTVNDQEIQGKTTVTWPAHGAGICADHEPGDLTLIEAAPMTVLDQVQGKLAETLTELSQVKAHADLTREQLDSLRRERAKAEELLAPFDLPGVTLDARVMNLLQRHREHDRINARAIDQMKQKAADAAKPVQAILDTARELMAVETLNYLNKNWLIDGTNADRMSRAIQERLGDLVGIAVNLLKRLEA